MLRGNIINCSLLSGRVVGIEGFPCLEAMAFRSGRGVCQVRNCSSTPLQKENVQKGLKSSKSISVHLVGKV